MSWGDFGSGGFCPGGFCPGGFWLGGFCPRGILSGGILSGGILTGGILSGGILSCHRADGPQSGHNSPCSISPDPSIAAGKVADLSPESISHIHTCNISKLV